MSPKNEADEKDCLCGVLEMDDFYVREKYCLCSLVDRPLIVFGLISAEYINLISSNHRRRFDDEFRTKTNKLFTFLRKAEDFYL